LDVIKDEFDRRNQPELNSDQALLLFNIGDRELTAGELRTKGYYLGSNVSYSECHCPSFLITSICGCCVTTSMAKTDGPSLIAELVVMT
ncbi:MAG: hypothetical protein WCK56_03720, partial [Alcaligenaceae bacterium]